jgi:hypothetical protein
MSSSAAAEFFKLIYTIFQFPTPVIFHRLHTAHRTSR